MITTEKISAFNPFRMKAFRCPVCASNKFTALVPYGGVWCDECNSLFSVKQTCDGIRKIAVDCITKPVHAQYKKDLPVFFGTVIWQGDTRITWIANDGKGNIITVDPTPH